MNAAMDKARREKEAQKEFQKLAARLCGFPIEDEPK
jgi:hypothetical protein